MPKPLDLPPGSRPSPIPASQPDGLMNSTRRNGVQTWRRARRIPAPGADDFVRKVPDSHPVGVIRDHNLGVFTVAKIAMENTGAVSPAHRTPARQGG